MRRSSLLAFSAALVLSTSPMAFGFSSNLPLLHLQTGGKPIDKTEIQASISILSGERNDSAELLQKAPELHGSVKIRGYSSSKFRKKQFSLDLHEKGEPKEDRAAALLGLPAHHSWVLSSQFMDRSLLRNPLGYEIARSLGSPESPFFGARTRQLELFINGKYQGVYTLTEKIDTSKGRVNLGKIDLENPEASPFMLKVEGDPRLKDGEFFESSRKSVAAYFDPKPSKIEKYRAKNPEQTKLLLSFIEAKFAEFEDAVAAIDDGKTGYRSLIEPRSFQNFILLQELFKNIDGFRRSLYLRYQGGRFHMGPVWDFDLALGNLKMWGQSKPKHFQSGHGWYIDGNPEIFWFKTLLHDPRFRSELVARYRELRKPGQPFGTDTLMAMVKRQYQEIAAAGVRNFQVWPYNPTLQDGPISLFMPKYGSDFRHVTAVNDLSLFLRERLDWLDRNIHLIGTKDAFSWKDAAHSGANRLGCSLRDGADPVGAHCPIDE